LLAFCAVSRHKSGEAKATCFPRTLASTVATLGVFLCLAGPLSGEEGAGGQYVPGAYASLLNITPNKPGFAVGDGFYFYTGGAPVEAKRCRSAGCSLQI
jgi:hypothetical protein